MLSPLQLLSHRNSFGSCCLSLHAHFESRLTSFNPRGEGLQWGRGLGMRMSRHFHHRAPGAHGNHRLGHRGWHASRRHALKWKPGSSRAGAAADTAGLHGSCFHVNWGGHESFLHARCSVSRSSLFCDYNFCRFFNKSCKDADDKHNVHSYCKPFAYTECKLRMLKCLGFPLNTGFGAVQDSLAYKLIKHTVTWWLKCSGGNLLRTLRDAVAEHCPNWFLAFTVYFPLSATVASRISRVYTFLERLSFKFDVTDICKQLSNLELA